MRKTGLLVVNLLLLLAFAGAVAGLLLYMELPTPWRGAMWTYSLHVWSGRAMLLLALVHIGLNWKWIRSRLFPRRKPRT